LFDRKKDSIKWSKRNEEHIHYDHVESRYHIWVEISPMVLDSAIVVQYLDSNVNQLTTRIVLHRVFMMECFN